MKRSVSVAYQTAQGFSCAWAPGQIGTSGYDFANRISRHESVCVKSPIYHAQKIMGGALY